MRKKILFIAFISISSLIFISLYTTMSSKKKLEYNHQREMESNFLAEHRTIQLGIELSLMRKIDDLIYFVSWKKGNYNKIFILNPQSEVVKEIELDINDNEIIIGEYFFEDDKIIVFNKKPSSLLIFDTEGNQIDSFEFPFFVSRLTKHKENFLISGWREDGDRYPLYFKKLHFPSRKLTEVSFNDSYLTEYDYMSGVILDGFYYKNENYIVNVPYSVNRLFIFNNDLEYSGPLKLIYKKLKYDFRTASNGEVYSHPDNIDPNISGFLDESNQLYLLTKDENKDFYIDIYNVESKEYLQSYQLNTTDLPKYIHVEGDHVFISFDDYIKRYNFKND